MSRWRLETLDSSSSYTFPVNPNAMASPHPKDGVTFAYGWRGGFTGLRKPAAPVDWSFRGVLRSQEEYDALVLWVTTYRTKVRLTTDRGEVLIIRLTDFIPDRKGPRRANVPWRHTYTVNALVFSYSTSTVVGRPASVIVSAPAGNAP